LFVQVGLPQPQRGSSSRIRGAPCRPVAQGGRLFRGGGWIPAGARAPTTRSWRACCGRWGTMRRTPGSSPTLGPHPEVSERNRRPLTDLVRFKHRHCIRIRGEGGRCGPGICFSQRVCDENKVSTGKCSQAHLKAAPQNFAPETCDSFPRPKGLSGPKQTSGLASSHSRSQPRRPSPQLPPPLPRPPSPSAHPRQIHSNPYNIL